MKTIVQAILNNDLKQVKQGIQNEGFEINQFILLGRSALSLAASCGHVAIMEYLTTNGADVNLSNDNQLAYTPLEEAARENKFEAINFLLKNGASVNKGNSINSNALIGACIGAHIEALQTLLDGGAAVDHLDNQMQSALHYLCRNAKKWSAVNISSTVAGVTSKVENNNYQKHYQIIEILLQHGANPNLVTSYGYTPLILAAETNSKDFIPLLIKAGATVNFQNAKGFTALHAACDKGNLECSELLIQANANINIEDEDGFTPILGAVATENTALVKLLLKNGANTTAKAKINYDKVQIGDNALSLAVRLQNEELLSLFFG